MASAPSGHESDLVSFALYRVGIIAPHHTPSPNLLLD